MTALSTLQRWVEDWRHRGQTLPEQYRGILPRCRICEKHTGGFDERGPLCIDCAVVKAMKGGA